jgi:putative heme-binding domain-containing protein
MPFRCHPRPVLAAVLLTFLVCSLRAAADKETFTQKPEIVGPAGSKTPPAAGKPLAEHFRRGPAPRWIWGPDSNRRYFLRKEIEGGSTAALLKATCDNRMVLSINGKEVAHSDTWQQPIEVEVHKHLGKGKNVLLAEVSNDGGPAGFLAELLVMMPGNKVRHVVSDATWTAAEKRETGKSLPVKVVGKLGDGPWGDVFDPKNQAGPERDFKVLPGFQVERLFTVPREQLGSWVSIAFDSQGRLIASDEAGKGLCRISLPPAGSEKPTRVEHLSVALTSAQGLVQVGDALYASINGGPGSGLYRARESQSGRQTWQVEKLRPLAGGGEHGPHGLVRGPDGKSLFFVCGNFTDLPERIDASRLTTRWAEDLLLPRQWDANGFARGRMAPGGWIARTDLDSKKQEIYSVGYRNAYRIAFNADGELFAYDSDMEWDMGMPWYRPTRLAHATSGSEFGWRSGSGKWPTYYVDSLPPVLDIGPGSPVGMAFGYGTRFPARYQKALYLCDWTFGTIYALHLEPSGSSYRAVKEEFLSRTPLPLTDVAVGPDGALYFSIGGRGTQSELFRVRYTGSETTAAVDCHDPRGAELRQLRHRIEKYHAPAADSVAAVSFVYPYLSHPDRFIRYAARMALEHQKPALWQERALGEQDAEKLITGSVALARQGDKALQPRLLAALDRLDFGALGLEQQLELARAYQLVLIRMGEPDSATRSSLAGKLDRYYPAASDELNRELCQLLVYLRWPAVLPKTITLLQQPPRKMSDKSMAELLARNPGYGGTIAQMLAHAPDLQKLHYLFVLRNVREGWTLEQRKVYFHWLNDARGKSGGASYQGFLNNIEKEAFDNATDSDRLAIEAAGLRKPFKTPELPKPKGPGHSWKLDDLVRFAQPRLKGRDFKNGQKMFAAARCIVCHRFNGEGGATGPDLTQAAGRFNLHDLCESIVEPSRVISDQYRASIVATGSGKIHTGRIVSETKDRLTIVTEPEDSTRTMEVNKDDVEEIKPSPTSLMPEGLLSPLSDDEVLDLLAYLLSRGDQAQAMFQKAR